jgi:hypothetical protein
MKHLTLTTTCILGLFAFINLNGQSLEKELKSFSRIVASPHINLVLNEGESEHIRIEYRNVDAHQINVEVRGKTLRLYLDEAKMTDPLHRVNRHRKASIYSGAFVTAYVTYKKLEKLQVRGAQQLTCESPIRADKFKLKAYGENEIRLAAVQTSFFKTHLYGENRLSIGGGKTEYQKYKLYGENTIDATKLKSYSATTVSFGESEIDLHSQDELRITSFGDAKVYYVGDAFVSKGLIFGRTEIQKN